MEFSLVYVRGNDCEYFEDIVPAVAENIHKQLQ
jgi:hypothetical protein